MIRALLFLALAVEGVHGADLTTDFEAANRAYEKGDYTAAAASYEKLAAGRASSELLFNLGNAYFRNGQIGRAIAAYRRAEQLNPRDPDIRANLKFALGAVPGNNSNISAVDRALSLLTLNERGAWTAVAVWLCFGSLALAQFRPALKNRIGSLIVAFAIFAIFFGAWYAQGLIDRATNRKAVVIAPASVVRFGPLEESQVSFNVRDGIVLSLLGKKDKWLQVADASNRSGWIPENDITLLP